MTAETSAGRDASYKAGIPSAGLTSAHAAFDRMRRAHERGTGCHLTAAMIAELNLTFMGEVWAALDEESAA